VLPNLKSKFIFDDELSTKNKKKCFTLLVVLLASAELAFSGGY
jgi:hypothetical protein